MMFFCLASPWAFFLLGNEPAELIPWGELAGFIIEISGWGKKGDPEGFQVEVPAKSEAMQNFVSEIGNRSLEIHIFDSAEEMIVLMPIKMMMHNNDDSQAYAETITMDGFPGVKTYDYAKKQAGLIVLILDRFVVQMFGNNFGKEEMDDLVDIVNNYDLEGIAKLKK
jgi:hypothetical protein